MRHSLHTAALGLVLADAGSDPLGPCFLRVRADAAADTAEVLIYGTIGDSPWFDSVSALALAEQIQQIKAGTINVRINSGGGVAADGIAIYNSLREHPAHKVMHVDGQAASIASVILMAGDEVVVYPTSLIMVHAPHTYAGGNSATFRQIAEALDTHSAAMVEAYVAKTGKREEVIRLLADGADHWYTGAQAVEFGFADTLRDSAAATKARAIAPTVSAVALTGYLGAITNAPTNVQASLRKHIAGEISPTVFASLPEAYQTAVIGHIEDLQMQQQYRRILANAGGQQPAPAPQPNPQPDATAQSDAPAAIQAVLAGLKARNTDIRAMAEPHLGNPEVRAYVDRIVAEADPTITADNVGRHILSLVGRQGEPMNGNAGVVAGREQRDLTRGAMLNAIQARSGIAAPESNNPFRGHTLAELARECVTRAGVDTRGLDRKEIVGLAFTHSTSDFPGLLGDTARKAVLKGYEEAEETFDQFTRPVSVADFKPTNLVGLGAFSDLDIVREGGEYKYGTFSEQSQAMQIVTYGKLFSITRQAIINDDLSAFNDVPRKLGQAAKRTIAKAIFNLINSNPILADGFALFSEEHGNLLAGSTISTASVDAMRQAMALQKDKDGNIIRVPMKTLLTPIALGSLARTVQTSENEVGGSKNLTTPNYVRNTFDVIDDGRLDAVSAKAWYGVANSAVVDSIVVGYLDGNQTPYLEQHEGFTVDGVAWKVRLDAAPAVADYRGIYRNPGPSP
jgi:ATP-dependent protease ClpP protease subunit